MSIITDFIVPQALLGGKADRKEIKANHYRYPRNSLKQRIINYLTEFPGHTQEICSIGIRGKPLSKYFCDCVIELINTNELYIEPGKDLKKRLYPTSHLF